MGQPPVYQKVFEYMEANYQFIQPDKPITRYYKSDIAERQYPALDGPRAPEKEPFAGEDDAAEAVEEFAWTAGADLVGFTKVKDTFTFEGADVEHRYAVALGMEEDFDLIATTPEEPAGIEVLRVYWRLADVAIHVARFIRSMGYPAKAHHPRSSTGFSPTILHSVAAWEAGLGEFGRLGVLLTEEFGPRVRFATVTTDLVLPQAERKSFGVEEFCRDCRMCRDNCEGEAIPDDMADVRGYRKYTIDWKKCLPEFAKTDGCGLCVSKCPFNLRKEDIAKQIRLTKNTS